MTNTFTRYALIAALTALTAAPAVAVADDDDDDDDLVKMRAIASAMKLITLEDAQAKALVAKPGTIVDSDLERRFMGKEYDYEFEIIDGEGNEWEVDINARDGTVRSVRKEWFD